MARGQQRDHLLDLYDLLRRATEKTKQRFAERLSQNRQARKCLDAAGKMRVAPPRESVDRTCECRANVKVPKERWLDRGGHSGRAGPLQRTGRIQTDTRGVRSEDSPPGMMIIRFTTPAERLATIQNLGQYLWFERRAFG